MGYLAAAGAYLIIGLVVSFILMVVGLFIGHIIVFDSIALGYYIRRVLQSLFHAAPRLVRADRRGCIRAAAVSAKYTFWILGNRGAAVCCLGGHFWAAGVYYLQCRSTLVLCGLRACFYRHAAAPYQGKR